MRLKSWAIPVLTLAIFICDLLAPVNVAVSILYTVPLLVTWYSPHLRDPLYVCFGATVLLWTDLFVRSPGIEEYGVLNRILSTLVLWALAIGLLRLKRRQSAGGALAGHQRSEEQYLINRLRLEGIIESAMDAIITVNAEQKVVVFNRAAERMFKYLPQAAIGQPLDTFIPSRFREAHRSEVNRFGQSGVTSRQMGQLGTITGLRSDGEEFPIEAAISHVTVEGTKFFTVILRDVTERTRLEEQLRRTERVAELGTVASGMAHEIGTPMNVILGRAEYLLDRVTDEPVKKGLQTIVAQVERITRVMNQLLSFARRKPPQPGPLRLQGVIENSLEMFQERLANRQVLVDLQLDPVIPHVQGDGDQMSQVIINLIMNALHAMPEGGTLRITLETEKGMAKLTVSDTGHGMSHDIVKKIFDPFFTTKEFGEGTGLGLTVVKGIIDEHRGTIQVDSEPGKGTTFTIFLPTSQ